MAWFASLVKNNKCDNIFMPMNNRNRVKEVDSLRAGNYLALPVFRKENLASPVRVRQHINGLVRPDKSYAWKLPSSSEVKKYIGGGITNWSSFYHHVEFDGFEQVMHFPVEAEMEGNGGGSWCGQEQDMVIFQADKNTLACLIYGKRDELTKEKLDGETILEGKLCDV